MADKIKLAIRECTNRLSDLMFDSGMTYGEAIEVGIREVIEHPERYGLMPIPAPTVLPQESDHPEYGKHGMCKRCNHTQAVMDYNGHGYWVCNSCDDALGREFDEEYR